MPFSLTPTWTLPGFYKKGELVRRRQTRVESRATVDKKYGIGLVTKEICKDGKWLWVEVYWQAMNTKVVEKKNDVERVLKKVERVILPKVTR